MTETTKTEVKVEEKKITFADLGLSDKLLKAIEKKGYEFPSAIQAGVIPLLLNGDKDIIGQAQTGTGKTASFGLPLLDLDEADEMLNIGFREEIEEILEHTPENKKTLLFSATMPREILQMAKRYMKDYDTVAIKWGATISDRINQSYYEVSPRNKFEALCRVVDMADDFYGIVFCKTKLDVDDVASRLMARGLRTEWIHGDIEQKTREKILWRFKKKKTDILVATDVAARGLDVNDLTYVINYSLPDSPETYTHRIGRTARAGKTGTAISFISRSDQRKLYAVERILKQKIPRGKTPNAKEVVEMQKTRMVGNITNLMSDEKIHDYSDMADKLMALGDPKVVIAALLKDSHAGKFDEKSYRVIEEKSRQSDRKREELPNGEQRLFVAKGRSADMAPGSLIKFLEQEVGIRLWDVGKIDILDKFSYINVQKEVAESILSHFKELNSRQPLVVQAKPRTGGGYQNFSSIFSLNIFSYSHLFE